MHDDETRQDELDQEPGQGAQEPPTDPPAPEPDPDPADDQPDAQSAFSLRYPRQPHGHYMLLAAKVTEKGPLRFRELGFIKAPRIERVKELASEDPLHGPRLRKDAEESGVVLRVVPARWWPRTDPSKVHVEKRLELK